MAIKHQKNVVILQNSNELLEYIHENMYVVVLFWALWLESSQISLKRRDAFIRAAYLLKQINNPVRCVIVNCLDMIKPVYIK